MTAPLIAFLLATASVSPAHAAEPKVNVDSDGTVVARVTVPMSEADVRAAVGQMHATERPQTHVLSVDLKPLGACQMISRTTRGLLSPMQLTTKRCPTARGWREWLVESSDFDAYEVTWDLSPQSDGTQVSVRVQTSLTSSVPDSMVRMGTQRSLKDTLADMLKRLGPGKTKGTP